jgi:hypothetical protein
MTHCHTLPMLMTFLAQSMGKMHAQGTAGKTDTQTDSSIGWQLVNTCTTYYQSSTLMTPSYYGKQATQAHLSHLHSCNYPPFQW